MSEVPTFGIVIPTYNAEGHIGRLLQSIKAQTSTSYSVAVVDQGSTDRTAEIARSLGFSVIDIARPSSFTPWVTPPLPAQSRNTGARSVEGRVLVHLDADMELGSPDFLERLEGSIDIHHQAAVVRESDVASGFWPRCKALERACHRGTEMEAARVVTRELFSLVGGYDEDVASGEDFLITRLYERETVVNANSAVLLLHHTGRYSLASLLKRKFTYGRTARTYLRKAHGVGGRSASSIVLRSMRAYARNWRLALRHPLLFVCIVPLRGMEFFAMLLGMWFGPRAKVAPAARLETPRVQPEDNNG